MNIFKRKLSVPLPLAIFLLGFLFLIPFVYGSLELTEKSFLAKEGPFWVLCTGFASGLAVALVQFLLSWTEFAQISKYAAMKIRAVLETRDSEEYYGKIIGDARITIDVQGVTSARFLRDFADDSSVRQDKQVLLNAITRGVRFRMLLPSLAYLRTDKERRDFEEVKTRLKALVIRFPQHVEVRYFDVAPIVSSVRIDDEILFGPVLRPALSKDTPTIHGSVSSTLGKSYVDFFEHTWDEATVLALN
jgi:hypothetical protein